MYLFIYIATNLQLRDALGGSHRWSLEIYCEAEIEWTQRFTLRPWSREVGDALGGQDRVNWELHMKDVIEGVWRFTWRQRSIELRAALGGRHRSSLEMHWEAVIERVWRCTWRPWSSEFGDALVAGYDRARLEEYLEVVDLEAVGGTGARCWDSIH